MLLRSEKTPVSPRPGNRQKSVKWWRGSSLLQLICLTVHLLRDSESFAMAFLIEASSWIPFFDLSASG